MNVDKYQPGKHISPIIRQAMGDAVYLHGTPRGAGAAEYLTELLRGVNMGDPVIQAALQEGAAIGILGTQLVTR
jgi:hypothetical protein